MFTDRCSSYSVKNTITVNITLFFLISMGLSLHISITWKKSNRCCLWGDGGWIFLRSFIEDLKSDQNFGPHHVGNL